MLGKIVGHCDRASLLGSWKSRVSNVLQAGGVLAALVAMPMLLTGCGSTGPYVWARDAQLPADQDPRFVILPEDTLSISVYNDQNVSGTVRVRSDGYITLMLVGDVMAAGKTPIALADEIRNALSKFLNAPTVAVRIETEAEISVAFVGEVEEEGVLKLPRGTGLLWAIASAGGLSDYADWDSIYVIRSNPRVKIRFDFNDMIANDKQSADFPLLKGDVVYVE